VKIVTILGTRPEIIRLSLIIPKLDRLSEHILVNTGQNYDPALNDLFFGQLDLRRPDYYFDIRAGSFGEQVKEIVAATEKLLLSETPDRVLFLGDTNSALGCIVAKRMGIKVYHMEAGNRCYDDRVPEEINRRIIDHCSDVLLPYTERSRQNLVREGIPGQRIHVTGNPIYEVIEHYDSLIRSSKVLAQLGLQAREYFLVSMHRAENVDVESRIRSFISALDQLQKEYQIPIVVSTHPHTRRRLRDFGLEIGNASIRFLEPFGFFDFISLERQAKCVLSDSGTVQEECAIFGVPNVTIRDVTERPETIECGSNMLSGAEPHLVLLSVMTVLSLNTKFLPPAGYTVPHVSDTVIKILLGYHHFCAE
jgi:UDP-N-acetylglucosamine 2-epimerase (non-hydrolysing)